MIIIKIIFGVTASICFVKFIHFIGELIADWIYAKYWEHMKNIYLDNSSNRYDSRK